MKDPMQRLFEEWFVEKLIKAGYKATVNPEVYEGIKQKTEKEKPPYKYYGVTIEESGRMAERLTKRLPDEFDGKSINVKENDGGSADIHYDDYECGMFYDAIAKLADLEDLQEQGRLLVLPAGFNLEKFRLAVASLFCPSVLGVDDVGCPAGDSVKRSDCLKCWEKVLKGE